MNYLDKLLDDVSRFIFDIFLDVKSKINLNISTMKFKKNKIYT